MVEPAFTRGSIRDLDAALKTAAAQASGRPADRPCRAGLRGRRRRAERLRRRGGGALTAELVADWTKDKLVVLRGLDSAATPEQITRETQKLQKEIDDFRQKGIDVAALTGGLASAIVSGKVDSGASAGRNAVEHNNGRLIAVAVGAAECVATGPICATAAVVAGMAVVWAIRSDDEAPGIGHNGGPKLDEEAPDNNPEPKGPHPAAYFSPGIAAIEIYRQVNAYTTRNSRHRELKEIFAGGNDVTLHVGG